MGAFARRARWCGWCSTHGSAGGFESVARSAVGFVLGLHGTAALPEMTDRKGTEVDRPVGGRWRSLSPVIRGRFRLFCPVYTSEGSMWAARATTFSLLLIQETEPVSIAGFFTTLCHHGRPAPPGLA